MASNISRPVIPLITSSSSGMKEDKLMFSQSWLRRNWGIANEKEKPETEEPLASKYALTSQPRQSSLSRPNWKTIFTACFLALGASALLTGVIAMKKNLHITPLAKQLAEGGGGAMGCGVILLFWKLINYVRNKENSTEESNDFSVSSNSIPSSESQRIDREEDNDLRKKVLTGNARAGWQSIFDEGAEECEEDVWIDLE